MNKGIFEKYKAKYSEVGYVTQLQMPVVYVEGLPGAAIGELVVFDSGQLGYVSSLQRRLCGVLLLSDLPVGVGSVVSRTGSGIKINVERELLGTVVCSLLNVLCIDSEDRNARYIESEIPLLSVRRRVSKPFFTGVTKIDMLVPLGEGQRELILGDRNTGKTAFALQVLATRASLGDICIYAGIGKKKSDLIKVKSYLEKSGAYNNSVILFFDASSPSTEIYLAPYVAMTIAEHFRDLGHKVTLILDDLTTHAKYYREISLVSGDYPGRDSYPGNIFHIHARLLERAGAFISPDGKETSITCLPIAETVNSDFSGFIQTNLMSMTDGHIFFDSAFFGNGYRPPINNFLSVTRVGRQTQTSLRWGVNRECASFLLLNQKTEKFVHFGTELNSGIGATLKMNELIQQLFTQEEDFLVPMSVQLITFALVWIGALKSSVHTYICLSKDKYIREDTYRTLTDTLVTSSESLNDFLGKVSAKKVELLLEGDVHAQS